MASRTADEQRAYRQRTGSFMEHTRQAAIRELIARHRAEFDAILADLRRRQAER